MSAYWQIRQRLAHVVLVIVTLIILVAYPLSRETAIGAVLNDWSSIIAGWSTVLGAWAVLLGVLIILRVNVNTVYRKESGWQYSLITIATLLLFFFAGFYGGSSGPYLGWLNTNVLLAVSSGIYGVEVFWALSAYYRAYRLKNLDAALLLISSIIVLMWMAPVFEYIIPGINDLAVWFMLVPNSAGQRAMLTGIGFGLIALAVRTLLGRERISG